MRKFGEVDALRAPRVFSLAWPRDSHPSEISVLGHEARVSTPEAFADIRSGIQNFDLADTLQSLVL